jgi:hypothetical protein
MNREGLNPVLRHLIDDACQAEELFGLDELEAYANKLKERRDEEKREKRKEGSDNRTSGEIH